jgi:hypothetical protein
MFLNTFITVFQILWLSENISMGYAISLDFKSIPIFLPPKQEQTAIANFLDYKLAKIDRFIRKKKQLIKLLNEQKAAIINEAVTGKKVWNGQFLV